MIGIFSFIFGIIEFFVGLRFIFLLLGANPTAPFVSWIYSVSTPFVAPFAGILGKPVSSSALVHAGASVPSVFDMSTLIALLVYGLAAGIVVSLFSRR
jgi:hypothetical protein